MTSTTKQMVKGGKRVARKTLDKVETEVMAADGPAAHRVVLSITPPRPARIRGVAARAVARAMARACPTVVPPRRAR